MKRTLGVTEISTTLQKHYLTFAFGKCIMKIRWIPNTRSWVDGMLYLLEKRTLWTWRYLLKATFDGQLIRRYHHILPLLAEDHLPFKIGDYRKSICMECKRKWYFPDKKKEDITIFYFPYVPERKSWIHLPFIQLNVMYTFSITYPYVNPYTR